MTSEISPRRAAYGPVSTLLLGLLLGGLLFLAQIIATAVVLGVRTGGKLSAARFAADSTRGDVVSYAIVAAAVAVSLAIALLVRLRRGPPLADYLALRLPRPRDFAIATGLACVLAVVSDGWLRLLGRPVVHPSMRHALDTAGEHPLLLVLAVIVAAPISEELLFRGFLYRGWLAHLKPWALALLTSVLWAALHVQYGLSELATIVLAGLALSELRRRTGSLWPPLWCHAVLNVIASLETLLL